MSASTDEILTREELDALLASLADESRERERHGRPGGPFRREVRNLSRRGPVALPGLSRRVEQWAMDRGRALSTAYQTTITCTLSSWELSAPGELYETVLPEDRLVQLELSPPVGQGFLLPSRSLVFSLLCLAFGARPSGARTPPPARSYTRTEKRFINHLAQETLASLETAWPEPVQARVLSLEEPQRLLDRPHDAVVVATIDFKGLADFARLRLLLPPAPFEALEAAPPASLNEPKRAAALTGSVLEMPVELRVEAGSTDLTLSRLAQLRVGDVIPIEPSDREGLVVKIEGKPRFRAIRGSVGRRLAVQVTQRLEA